jgi:glyoxylase-like metal-dependent hydrolase (beta-lactamase superfamily II)
MTTVKLTLLSAGYCLGKENQILKDGRNITLRFPAMFALIEHPTEGAIVFDTGYTSRFYDVTRRFPNRIYAHLTPTTITDEKTAGAKLRALGYPPENIRHVILSHLHADHIAGVCDFPNARFIGSKTAFDFARDARGFRALKAAFIPELLPDDFLQRTDSLSPDSACYAPDPFWDESYDLFGDGSLRMVPLPGHARGQMGVLVQTDKREVLLAADVCWHSRSYREMVPPSFMARLIVDSWSEFMSSLDKVHRYHRAHPDTLIVPTHCQEIFDTYIKVY